MNPPFLSIVIASHNDPDQTVLTIASIRETAPEDIEIIVVDDCSCTGLVSYIKPDNRTKLVTNLFRIGCGPSRHVGALHATGDWLFIVDSHVRFKPGWFPEWEKLKLNRSEEDFNSTLFCGTCLGITSKNMDVMNPVSKYHGATLNLYGPDRNAPTAPPQVFEAVWIPKEPEPQDQQELGAIMGACYLCNRDWFLMLSATSFLRFWGCDEQNLSIATWLSGGTVRLAKNIEVAHKFLIANREVQSFGIPPGYIIWNKMASMSAMLPSALSSKLIDILLASSPVREAEVARRMFRDDHFIVATQKAYYKTLFVRDFRWYCDRFKISVP